jgi:hypothetical protein
MILVIWSLNSNVKRVEDEAQVDATTGVVSGRILATTLLRGLYVC